MRLLEVCVESPEAAVRAVASGAQRIELCADLCHGGVTPDEDVVRKTLLGVDVPVHVMVRCRPGNFRYNGIEMKRMQAQAEMVRRLGAHGVVFGALDSQGNVDVRAVSQILDCAGELSVTFHRAFDESCHLPDSLDALIDLRITRVLTSGGAQTAWEGRTCLRDLVRHADGRIIVMAGGGVRPTNARQLIAETGVAEVHSSVPFLIEADADSIGNRRAADQTPD